MELFKLVKGKNNAESLISLPEIKLKDVPSIDGVHRVYWKSSANPVRLLSTKPGEAPIWRNEKTLVPVQDQLKVGDGFVIWVDQGIRRWATYWLGMKEKEFILLQRPPEIAKDLEGMQVLDLKS